MATIGISHGVVDVYAEGGKIEVSEDDGNEFDGYIHFCEKIGSDDDSDVDSEYFPFMQTISKS